MPIYKAITNHLIALLSNTPHVNPIPTQEITPLDILVQDAVAAQSSIGWQHFLKERISKK